MVKINDLNIGLRLTLILSTVIILVVGSVLFFLQIQITDLVKTDAEAIAESVIQENKIVIQVQLDQAMNIAMGLAQTAEASINNGHSYTREHANNVLQKTLESNPQIFGVCYLFEPNAFDNLDEQFKNQPGYDESGRYIPYFYYESEGKVSYDVLAGYNEYEYYQVPKKQNSPFVSDPFEYVINDKGVLMVSLVYPVKDLKGNFIGIASCDIIMEEMNNSVSRVRPFKDSGYLNVIAQDGTIMGGFLGQFTGQNIHEVGRDKGIIDPVFNDENYSDEYYDEGLKDHVYLYGSHFKITGTDYLVTVEAVIPQGVIFQQSRDMILTVLILGSCAFIIIGVFIIFFSRNLSRQLGLGVEFANRISQGDLTVQINIDQKDEIGQLASALSSMAQKLSSIVKDVQEASSNVNSGSSQISSTSETMSQGAAEQAASTEEVSASIEQMASSIVQNSENSGKTEVIAQKAAQDASDGGVAVSKAVNAMKQIASKINIIDEIARNTNLLALNAAIEAARAGEAGKGFSVVASEVRKLAERSQIAAAEITELSRSSTEVAEDAGNLLNKIIPDIQKTAELVHEISSASREQSSGASQINSAILQLDSVVQMNASSSEELASMSEELSSQAVQLIDIMKYFKVESTNLTLTENS